MGECVDLRELLNAFKVLGGNRDGRIDYNRTSSLLRNKMHLSKQEVCELLESDCCRKEADLDFLSLCMSVLSTKEAFDRVIAENERPTSGKKINSQTFTRRKGSGRSSSSNSGSRKSAESHESSNIQTESLKGGLFNTDPSIGLCGNRFLLELHENSSVEIIAQAIDSRGCCSPSPAIEILMFIENEEPNKKLVTFSSFVNAEGYCTIKMNLRKGKYLLVPVTLSWNSKVGFSDLVDIENLTEVDSSGETELTQNCKTALKTIFDFIDLDRNGMLSQVEFDLFIQHICGETAADEWSTVEDNFDTVNGELTFDGFLALYKMALLTDLHDVANMFRKMGLDNSLTMEKGLPFLLSVTAKTTKPVLKPLVVSTFESLMEEVFRKTAMEQGHCTKIRNMNDLLLYTHELAHRVTVVVKNLSHSKVKIQLDCRNSENCVSHRPTLDFTFEVSPRTSMIGHHLFPAIHGEPWSVQCIEALVE